MTNLADEIEGLCPAQKHRTMHGIIECALYSYITQQVSGWEPCLWPGHDLARRVRELEEREKSGHWGGKPL